MSEKAVQPVHQFITGFIEQDSQKIVQTLAPHVVMLGGDSSDDPLHLQAHMFLTGTAVIEWVRGMVDEASPHENRYQVVHTHERMGATVVVTQETGRNRFRTWEDLYVTYILGNIDDRWKIIAYYLRVG